MVDSNDLQRDEIIVVDVEATCWRNGRPADQKNDIIEIGIAALKLSTGQRSNKRSILVKPARSRVSAFCTELTTLTQADVDSGIAFSEACLQLVEDYHSLNRPWASWGNYDWDIFEEHCKQFNVPYPFSPYHLNVKQVFRDLTGARAGMARALRMTGLPLEGTHHRGADDAWNIAGLLAHMIHENGHQLLTDLWNLEEGTL